MTTVNIHEEFTREHQFKSGKPHIAKRCPECFSNLPMNATICPWCNQKVTTKVNKHGHAKKPIDWYAYVACLLSWVAAGFYIWWVFFK